jgi:hypothetical protein
MSITNWHNVADKLPTKKDIKSNKRIIIFSPCYKHDQHKYRFIDAQFLTRCIDATHWAYATPPVNKKKGGSHDDTCGSFLSDGIHIEGGSTPS